MADYFQTIVDTRVGLEEADHLARHVVSLLSGRGVVSSKASEEGGYDRGPNAAEISQAGTAGSLSRHEAIPPVYTHLQVLIGRMTHSGDLSEFKAPGASCPDCRKPLEDPDGDWQAATQAWIGGDDDAGLLCAGCGKESPVATWATDTRWGFGNLAFRFWNWPPLSPAFLDEMRRELQHPIVLVEGKTLMRRFLAPVLLLLLTSARLQAQDAASIPAAYTKQETSISMRDGKKLFTSIYLPKDTSKYWPILLTRTPYGVGPYGADNYRTNLGPSSLFIKEGFIFVYQDVRGRNRSEGEFVNVTPHRPVKAGPADTDESSDAYDTIDWLVKNLPNNNGKVGMYGISYPGFYTAAGAIDAHPALKAASPQAPVSDWFVGDDFHHNGAFYLAHAFRFFDNFGRAKGTTKPKGNTADAYSTFLEMGTLAEMDSKYFKGDVPYWTELRQHPNYDDWWKARNIRPHLKAMKPAMLTVGGWFDAEDLFGALKVYEAIERQSPGATNTVVMGPWFHGGWAASDGESLGRVQFGSKTSVFFREQIEFPFFCRWLKDKEDPKLPEAYMFETGANRWRKFDVWPPATVAKKALYFHAGGKLSFDAPREEAAAFDEYVSNPAKPVPYIGGQAAGMTREHMVDDQRFAASRPDVLSYRTEPLEADLTIAGEIRPDLRVSTTGTDSDWVVKLIDVYPDDAPDPIPPVPGVRMGGFQQLLRGECMRGRFRNSYEKPEPFQPGKMEKVEYPMPDVLHTFKKGHRIMVQVQSSWFPLIDRNPQTYVDIYQATEADFQTATQRIYRHAAGASSVGVGVLN